MYCLAFERFGGDRSSSGYLSELCLRKEAIVTGAEHIERKGDLVVK